jgi:hypothetical protein
MRTCWIDRRRTGAAVRVATVPPTGGVTTPLGPDAAAEVFAWLNRQLTWQSRLADLEGTLRTRRRARTS